MQSVTTATHRFFSSRYHEQLLSYPIFPFIRPNYQVLLIFEELKIYGRWAGQKGKTVFKDRIWSFEHCLSLQPAWRYITSQHHIVASAYANHIRIWPDGESASSTISFDHRKVISCAVPSIPQIQCHLILITTGVGPLDQIGPATLDLPGLEPASSKGPRCAEFVVEMKKKRSGSRMISDPNWFYTSWFIPMMSAAN